MFTQFYFILKKNHQNIVNIKRGERATIMVDGGVGLSRLGLGFGFLRDERLEKTKD